ncbi:uncharacterized protein LOC143604252 [Bidens hawaiensis]|uniref:uncharacterized protein LOC143604252 n=1 Tax=Bidens hawaiensis TaxID=980011 RepID=UPI00404B3C2C
MVRPSFIDHTGNNHIAYIPLGIGLFVMVSMVVALCAKHGRKASKKEDSKDGSDHVDHVNININKTFDLEEKDDYYESKLPPRSPLRSPRQLITTISNKAMSSLVINHKKSGGGGGDKVVDEGFGEGGLWQREILRGVKCQPPEFSGVIYYDCDGRRVSEFTPRSPRSPRIAPSPQFSFPVVRS